VIKPGQKITGTINWFGVTLKVVVVAISLRAENFPKHPGVKKK
jgi:hypothetical protein